jgi:hypothetical protein
LEQQIAEEKTRIATLDSTLDAERTPYLKSQLKLATHLLDDAQEALRMEAQADSNYRGIWVTFAGTLLQAAAQLRQNVQQLVEKYGGPANVIEIGGHGGAGS